jgi:hypothetical protein
MEQRIILRPDEPVTCPKCDHEFALREGIARQTIERYEEEYEAAFESERKLLRAQLEQQAEKRAARAYDARIAELQEQVAAGAGSLQKLREQVVQEKEQAAAEARAEADRQAAELREELEAKGKKLAEYRAQELELRKEKQALEEARAELEIQVQRRLDEEKKRIEQQTADTFRLREAEYKKKIEDAQRANDELKRKLEQGSQQLQGEVLELELEEILNAAFPLDQIDAVRKGARGADVVQTVMTRSGVVCGKIIWEAKRAENWSNNWIPKLKDDQQAAGAELAVLVSTAFPAGTSEPFLQEGGVWLVRPAAIRPVAEALRAILTESQKQKAVSVGKNEKMEALYDYLCSPRFAQKIRGVVDAYDAMREDLEKEKAAMQRLWKKREAQLERITANMMGMCGELQGVADNALPQLDTIGVLPLDED